ncbi:4Fe-4S dicluster domain-containing protein [Salipaludibacillus aurantiacus]|uniref:Fe-S-cluster-containing dehydrogenase component n=1 Tax=Salipaludibacillus aurantiacus TaxID=1601833 RepID=A0A1H9W0L9_9BACI|nr:4Fe-4S dicluster domain-containing protein [Salipaludibacillus aurantiacus]SES27291.1 Fe-S-cluster-containing dehydrogenase component [Salipaludibacillus aurantiacus]
MIKQIGFLFRADRCVSCHACVAACINENRERTASSFRRVDPSQTTHYLSLSCNHCDNPECMRVCPEQAFIKRRDGVVKIEEARCNGCEKCVNSCPYRAIQIVDSSLGPKARKCELCHERFDRGKLPACTEACTTSALMVGDIDILPVLPDKQWKKDLPGLFDSSFTYPSIRLIAPKKKKRYFLI